MLKSQKNDVVIFGASGDLARRKIYPSLYSLHEKKMLPVNTNIIGYGRSEFTKQEFHEKISSFVKMSDDFLHICEYVTGRYDSIESLNSLTSLQSQGEDNEICNRLFYLSTPATVYEDILKCIPMLYSKTGWNRILIEKPFGSDMDTFLDLKNVLETYTNPNDVFCVDHYLWKTVVNDIANIRDTYSDRWNIRNIASIYVSFRETIGIEDRQYFDEFGIVRDIIQNHVLQILAQTISTDRYSVLRHCSRLDPEASIFGQYIGYRTSKYVSSASTTPTYFHGMMYYCDGVHDDVPIFVEAGKRMYSEYVHICIELRDGKKITLKIQPEYTIEIDTICLQYEKRNAYEDMLRDIMNVCNTANFVTLDEIRESWRIVQDVLNVEKEPIEY